MAILITGGNGFIGKHLTKELISSGEKVIILDLKESNFSSDLKFISGNILDKNLLIDIKKKYPISKIYHLASAIGVDFTDKYKLNTLNIIIEGTKNILEIFGKDIDFFFYASSSEVYGSTEFATESDQLRPFSTYGIAKIAAEEYVKIMCSNYKLRYFIGRFFNVFGPEQSKNFVVSKFIDQALKNEDIFINGNGSQKRCFTYVEDVSKILAELRTSNESGIFNLGNPKNHYSIKELAFKIIEISNSRSKIYFSNAITHDVSERIPNIKKIIEKMNWEPKISLDKGIKKIIQSR
jgi:UDP-glucose 4-epimerase